MMVRISMAAIDEVATGAAEQGIEKTGGDAFHDAEQHACEQRAADAVHPAENRDRHPLEQQLRRATGRRLATEAQRTPAIVATTADIAQDSATPRSTEIPTDHAAV